MPFRRPHDFRIHQRVHVKTQAATENEEPIQFSELLSEQWNAALDGDAQTPRQCDSFVHSFRGPQSAFQEEAQRGGQPRNETGHHSLLGEPCETKAAVTQNSDQGEENAMR